MQREDEGDARGRRRGSVYHGGRRVVASGWIIRIVLSPVPVISSMPVVPPGSMMPSVVPPVVPCKGRRQGGSDDDDGKG